MEQNDWMNNPKLKNISPEKLAMIKNLAQQANGKSNTEMLPFLMAAANNSKKSGLSFSAEETELMIEVLKMGKSKQEIEQINKVMNLMKMMK